MGKNIISQRRGRGTMTYLAHSHRWKADVKHRNYDDIEKNGVVYGRIIDIVDCPGHTAPLAKIKYENKEVSYIFAPNGTRVNDTIASGFNAPIKEGNTLPLKKIPEGTTIFNVEKLPADGGSFARASGTFAKVVSSSEEVVLVELPSRKQIQLNPLCRATIGTIAGSGRIEKPLVKAGKAHHKFRAIGKLYPRTSGVAMNAVDHPFGSGRGRHIGKSKIAPRFAPPGRNVGLLRPKRTGWKK